MIDHYLSFADAYMSLTRDLIKSPTNIQCRGLKVTQELSPVHVSMDTSHGVSVFSHYTHRVVPIRFVLAEFLYIMAGRGDIASIASYNKSMMHFSDDGVTNGGSYGLRLRDQLPRLIERIVKDPSTRQACAAIYWSQDTIDGKVHIPCNVFLQVLIRDGKVNLYVTSRSSDFVTGFSIDAIHWQMLLWSISSELQLQGLNVDPGNFYYSLNSLHIYETEKDMVFGWYISPYIEYGHFLRPYFGLFELIDNAKKNFSEGLTVTELAALAGLVHQSSKITELDGLFREHKNLVKR